MLEGWWISLQNFKSTSSKMAEIRHKTCQNQALLTLFRDFITIFRILFFTDFDASKSVLGSFFALFAKIWPRNMSRSRTNPDFFYLFYLVTWDDLDLYYGHKAQEIILTNVRDTIQAHLLALFELNIEILLADVTKPENFDFDLTCDVTGDPEVIKICFPSTVFRAFKCRLNFFRKGQVVSEIRGRAQPSLWIISAH